VTNAQNVRIISGVAMNPSRFASFASALLVATLPGLVQCELNASAPPATAQNAAPPGPAEPEPAPGAPAEATGEAPAGETSYASGEYAIGEDPDAYEDNDPSALTDFRATLSPYGTWTDDSTYGTVWTPSPTVVGADFTPYSTAGHWVYDDDWVWISDYDWGWAPFHYGRWVWVDGRGWMWIPGRVYRGAWVAWGVDDGYGYLGWYPMGPSFIWWGGVAVGYPYYVGPRWVYCPRGEVFSPTVGTRILAGPAVAPIAARVHAYAGATPGVVAGPSPQKFGYAANQVPHASGAELSRLSHAQQFARASTAQSLGAHMPSRVPAPAPGGARGASTGVAVARPGVGASPAVPGATARPGTVPFGRKPGPAPHVTPAPRAAPTFRGGSHPSFPHH
jgi:hypothetical protein